MSDVPARIGRVRDRIAAAAARAGRDPDGIVLMAAVKHFDPGLVSQAVAAGVSDVGVNRAQVLKEAAPTAPGARWHFLGPLQTNKVRYLDPVHMIHALTRTTEAEALQRRGERSGRSWDVLIEVNVAQEAGKHGVTPSDVADLLARLEPFPLVRPRGFMIVAPQAENAEDVRWVFARARELRDQYGAEGSTLRELSMGMSDDFEIAIEEGATIVRVGRAIFED